MQKIISLYQRDHSDAKVQTIVRDEIVPGAEWVAAGEGVATRKWDGTCCLIRDGKLYKRYDAKHGKTPPADFEPAQPEADPITGHWPGWRPVSPDAPEDKAFREASLFGLADGTYELCGPKVNGNPEGFDHHILIRHGLDILTGSPRTYDECRRYLSEMDIEGIVWHHPDGRMVKIKAKDFGLKRGAVHA